MQNLSENTTPPFVPGSRTDKNTSTIKYNTPEPPPRTSPAFFTSDGNDQTDSQRQDNPTPQGKLELGDIIEIRAPSNSEINEQVYAIQYIDDTTIRLINVSTYQTHTLTIDDDVDGKFTDETIREIRILCRSKEKGYARQHDLVTEQWVDIHFGGEVPTIISGEITNLEEDMIEITTFPERTVLYIDFEYKGLPEHLPLEKFVLRDRPESLGKTTTLARRTEDEGEHALIGEDIDEAYMEYTETGEAIIHIPENAQPKPTTHEWLRSFYLDAAEIIEEEMVDDVRLVEVPESKRRYTLDAQLIDMTDEFISTVPVLNRTHRVFQRINNLIHKYRQLRHQFSVFDKNGNIVTPKKIGAFDKPLVDVITKLTTRLRWLMPVVQLRKELHQYNKFPPIQQPDVENVFVKRSLDILKKTMDDYFKNVESLHPYDNMIQRLLEGHSSVHPPESFSEILLKNQPVQTDMDVVVGNFANFNSTILKEHGNEGRKRFLIHRFGEGYSKMVSNELRTGKKSFVREEIVPSDRMNIRSLLVFPEQFVQYSRVEFPGTNIYDRSRLSVRSPAMFRMLKDKTKIETVYVNDLSKELEYTGLTEDTSNAKDTTIDKSAQMTFMGNPHTIKEYVLDTDIAINGDTFGKFLNVILPKKRLLIEFAKHRIEGPLSVFDMIRILEPFMVYTTDITFSHYKEIRYFVKEEVKKYKASFKTKENDFRLLKTTVYGVKPKPNVVESMLQSDIQLDADFRECYYLNGKPVAIFNANTTTESSKESTPFPSELLHKIYSLDGGQMYLRLINKMLISLVTPDKIINSVEVAKLDDMTNMEKIRASDCYRRYIAKKYTSLDALRKDNNNEDVFYDKEYDDTPYDLLKKYKAKKNEMLPELFFDYFKEVLISKHDCPESMASELAQTILLGKKKVKDGYAILELRPTLRDAKDPTAEVDETQLSPKEQEQIRIESDARKRIQYYKRVNDYWVRDESVDESSFVDSNTLLCDISRECIQTTPSKVCAPTDTAATRMKVIALNRMQNEFDRRVSMSFEEIEQEIDTSLKRLNESVFRKRILSDIIAQRPNDYAYSLGQRVVEIEHTESPFEPLRRMIMGQTDFVKRQTDIIRFVEIYAREPMTDKNEEQYWMYCRETNTRLFPLSIYLLAKAFIQYDNYSETLDQICAQYGELSGDGDCIIDKHTHYVLRQIDFVEEEGYDESGFRIITNKVMEKDFSEAIQDAFTQQEKVFDSEEAQYAYNVFWIIGKHIGIRSGAIFDEIDEFTMRVTTEIMNDTDIVMSEKSYLKTAEKRAKMGKDKDKEKQIIPYKVYRHQLMIQTVASATLIALMTLVPSFKSKKTFPGCVQSFHGFPVDAGEEDVSALKYISCILFKSKSSVVPWNSIEPLSTNTIQKRMKDFISGFLLKRPDIQKLCAIKREYLAKHPDEVIPTELNVAKWTQYRPPLVEFHVTKTLHSVGTDFEDELLRAMREGSRGQFESIGILKSKLERHVCGIIEMIQSIVSKKDLLLTTASREPFMENACCATKTDDGLVPLLYFIKENVEIENYLKKIGLFISMLRRVNQLSKPAIMFHDEPTGIERGEMVSEIDEHIIYGAFIHYCNFDRDIPIPPELELVCNQKPAVYNRLDGLDAKIEKMKSNGKRFTKSNLEHLMSIVNRQNRVSIYYGANPEEVSQINQFKNVLEELDLRDSDIVDSGLRELLWQTLGDYNPLVMVNEERDSNAELNRYLDRINGRMYAKITEFLDQHGNLSNAQYDALQVFIHEICVWKMDSPTNAKTIYTVHQFVTNAIESMVNIFPEHIRNKHVIGLPWETSRHWKLSFQHCEDLNVMIFQFYKVFDTYYGNKSLNTFLQNISTKLSLLLIFVKQIPLFMPIIKDTTEYHALFSKETVYLLLKYAWYSVLYEYVVGVEDPDILEIDRKERITERRQLDEERADQMWLESIDQPTVSSGTDEENDAVLNPLMEVELEMGNLRKIKDTTGGLLVDLLKIFMTTKQSINMSYDEIRFKTQRKRDKEKKQITDAFEKMERTERKVEDMLKQFKIGRWNIGMQKSLFKYKSDTYARQKELNKHLNEGEDGENDNENEIELTIGQTQFAETDEAEVEDLEREEQMEINREYDAEAYDIGGLGEDYTDGQYYEEDMDDDIWN